MLPKRKQNIQVRDKINYILSRARTVLALRYAPIQSYAAANSKSDVINNYYLIKVAKQNIDEVLDFFEKAIAKLYLIKKCLIKDNASFADNTLLFEGLFWGFSVIYDNSSQVFDAINPEKISTDINQCANSSIFWKNIIIDKKEIEEIFFATGSHYYKSIINRYTFISNYLSAEYKIDFTLHMKNKSDFDSIMAQNPNVEQYKDFKLSKTDPVSATVYDILSDVKSSKFIIRPDYQRSEVPNNKLKASYLLESILLGIRIPPIFIYRRKDKVSEVIDGQQRLLSILGFLRESYKDENGQDCLSDKNGFFLSKLRFLKELNGKDIDGVEKVDSAYKDRILDFQIDIVEINEEQNPNFSPIDLFLRLNSKPFPIEPNTFEMWNAYVTKEYVETIKLLANQYASKLFKPLDTRMKNEELITMLAYLAYIERKNAIKPGDYLNIFVRNQRINARFNTKSYITSVLSEISSKNDSVFGQAIEDVKEFIEKINILTGENFENLNELLAHTKKNTQSKTNQNFYLLWIAVAHIDKARILKDKEEIFLNISNLFAESQNIKDDTFDVKEYINKLATI